MRTYLIILVLLAITIPLAIKYGINTATRTADVGPCMISPPIQEQILPNNLDNLKKNDAFQPNLSTRPKDEMINTDFEPQQERVGQNCQFGICLPGQQQPQNVQSLGEP